MGPKRFKAKSLSIFSQIL